MGVGSGVEARGGEGPWIWIADASGLLACGSRVVFLHEGKVAWQGTQREFDTTDEPIVRQLATGSLEGPISYL